MDVAGITKEDVEFFFNKYKHNSDQIAHLERKLLNESYDFNKWEEVRYANSKLTRELFLENEKLLNDYIHSVIKNPGALSKEALHTYALHTTFFLFENNIDSLVTEELIKALFTVPENLDPGTEFELHMNIGISKTVSCRDSFDEAMLHYEKAMEIFPTFKDAPDDNFRIHQVFCLNYQLLAFDLYKSNDLARMMKVYNRLENLLKDGTEHLFAKMWSPEADFAFHIDLLMRYMRMHLIFAAGAVDFKGKNPESQEDKTALKIIEDWLTIEYEKEKAEGMINPMVYTFFHKMLYLAGELTQKEYVDILFEKYTSISSKLHVLDEEKRLDFIYPDMASPNDGDPVSPRFTDILDQLKLFNWSFSYVYVLLPELYTLTEYKHLQKEISREILLYYEHAPYAAKGFQTDGFIINMVKTLANSLYDVNEFLFFVQTIFVHREITSAIHFSMVSNLFGICLSYMIDSNPELFILEEYNDAEKVLGNRQEFLQFVRNAGFLHDLGKIGLTDLINLHFRNLTKEEYQKIKQHPEMGAEIASGIPYLEPYIEMIKGHHKFHDGIGGYPETYDQTSSKYSVFIDLLTFCDCIDTATDDKGRNYAKTKGFDQAFEEMKKEVPFRYSKEIIEIIDSDEALKDELRYMTSTGRNYTSYETYQRFIMPNTTFSESDVKSVVEVKSDNKEVLNLIFDFYREIYPEKSDDKINMHIDGFLDGKRSKLFVLMDCKKQIFGLAAGKLYTPITEDEPYFLISEFFVHPKYRRRGNGTDMLYKMSEELAKKNVHNLRIGVVNDFSSETFFWIAGFVKTKAYLMNKKI